MSLVSTKLMSLTNSKSSFSFPKSNRKSTVKNEQLDLHVLYRIKEQYIFLNI